MSRPKLPRRICFSPDVYYFKPRGIPLRELDEVILEEDELEALKLYEVDELDQTNAAKQMRISQPTFARLIRKANQKLAKAVIGGMAIRIESEGNAK